jgi:hypothetical protein
MHVHRHPPLHRAARPLPFLGRSKKFGGLAMRGRCGAAMRWRPPAASASSGRLADIRHRDALAHPGISRVLSKRVHGDALDSGTDCTTPKWILPDHGKFHINTCGRRALWKRSRVCQRRVDPTVEAARRRYVRRREQACHTPVCKSTLSTSSSPPVVRHQAGREILAAQARRPERPGFPDAAEAAAARHTRAVRESAEASAQQH